MWIHLILCVFAINFIEDVCGIDLNIKDNPRIKFPVKRAIDGTRGSKFFQLPVDDSFDVYDNYDDEPDFSDYRSNIPGEPGLDYPSFTRIPQTSFTCKEEYRGYYADEEAGCQLFHVCDGNFLVSSFLCPVGSTFSQKFLTCDWWNKVDCSATRNFYQVNNQIVISQVDDDEILRKAYEMTSLQTTRNGIAIADPKGQSSNDVNRRLSHINDLHNSGGGDHYSEYQNPTSKDKYPQFKYSSRYSSDALDQHDRDIDYYPRPPSHDKRSSIVVETIGKDYKNDKDDELNHFQPSYAPTVPTVTTTTRRYYSPTIPPITRSTPRPGKYDLEFESSDHLYSAKGKQRQPSTSNSVLSTAKMVGTTIPTVTPSASETSTQFFVDRLPLSGSEKILKSTTHDRNSSLIEPSLVYQPPLNKENNSIFMDKSRLIVEYSTVEINNRSVADRNITDYFNNETLVITNPSTEILPPFFYYANVAQHDAVLNNKPEELTFNLTAIDDSTVDYSDHIENYSEIEINNGRVNDTVEEESSPFQVTVTVKNDEEFHPNGELIRSIIAQQDYTTSDRVGDFEIRKSDSYGKLDDVQRIPMNRNRGRIRSRNYSRVNSMQTKNSNLLPRPFSLKPSKSLSSSTSNDNNESKINYPEYSSTIESTFINSDAVTAHPSAIENNTVTTINDDTSSDLGKTEILHQLTQTFGQPLYKAQEQLIFDLPSRERSLDFQSGESIRHDVQIEEKIGIDDVESTTDEKDSNKTLVETEFVPSLGFSLDTAEEREQYVDAVLSGLFQDSNAPDTNKKSVNVTES